MEGKRNKRLKSLRLLLQMAKLKQVVDDIIHLLYMIVKHGGVGFQSHAVGDAHNIQPFFTGYFFRRDDIPDPGRKNFGAAAGERVNAGVHKPMKDVLYGQVVESGYAVEGDKTPEHYILMIDTGAASEPKVSVVEELVVEELVVEEAPRNPDESPEQAVEFEIEPIELPIANVQDGLTEWNGRTFDASVARTRRVLPDDEMDAFYLALIRKVDHTTKQR